MNANLSHYDYDPARDLFRMLSVSGFRALDCETVPPGLSG